MFQPAEDDTDEAGLAPRHTDTHLQTGMTSAVFQRRLLRAHYDARTGEEEPCLRARHARATSRHAPTDDCGGIWIPLLVEVRLRLTALAGASRLGDSPERVDEAAAEDQTGAEETADAELHAVAT